MYLNTYFPSQYICTVKLQCLFMQRVSYTWLFWEMLSIMNHGPQTNHSLPCSKRGGQSLNKPLPLSVISILGTTCTFPVQTLSTFFFLTVTFTVHILVGQGVWLIPLVQNQILEVYHSSNYLQWQQEPLISPSVWRLTPLYHGLHAWERTDLKQSKITPWPQSTCNTHNVPPLWVNVTTELNRAEYVQDNDH